MTNREWIAKGSTGCTFASLFAKSPEVVGWKFYPYLLYWDKIKTDSIDDLIISIEFFGGLTKEEVRKWALSHGFYEEDTSEGTVGLRIKCKEGVSWVQYFGPDSHVVTRRSPLPMLMYTNKLGVGYYAKVGFKGILHLAHAWYDKIGDRVYDLLWDRSYEQTKKKIGHAPTIIEAAKTTFLK